MIVPCAFDLTGRMTRQHAAIVHLSPTAVNADLSWRDEVRDPLNKRSGNEEQATGWNEPVD